jgi:DUF1680 family protein
MNLEQQVTAATPMGQLQERMELTRNRLRYGISPTFTQDFILADVVLDPANPRRFNDFSGDLSGRFIEAMALAGQPVDERVHILVREILSHQRSDGRFGRADLSFDSGQLDREHMALLWGNGRLLVGLLAYHAVHPHGDVLGAAQRLAEFIARVCDGLHADDLNRKLATAGAYGFVCLTQCNEGLAMLHRATLDPRWLELGLRVCRWLAPAGTQHSHGVLTTLRGRLMLYGITGNGTELASVREFFDPIVQSRTDHLVFGGVLEYFGADVEQARSHSGGHARDEGCSEADFVRLCLQLWRAAGEVEYLQHAEHCLLNHLYANQFDTGDFGCRVLSHRGFGPSESPGRGWWCCTMHGLRAFADVLEAAASRGADNEVRVNLFLQAKWSDAQGHVDIEPIGLDRLAIHVRRAPAAGVRLSIRQPQWSDPIEVSLGSALLATARAGGYVTTAGLTEGTIIQVKLNPRTRLLMRDGTELAMDQLPASPVEGALFHGPWLMGVSASRQPLFFSEPSMGNVIQLPRSMTYHSQNDDVTIDLPYQHEGYVQLEQTTLCWVGGPARNAGGAFAVWLRYQRGA